MAKKGTKQCKYSPEFKLSVIMDMRENNLSYRETMRKYLPHMRGSYATIIQKWERVYLEEGLEKPKCIDDAIQEYKEDMDLVSQWINEYCEIKPSYFERANTLYDSFKAFCQRRDQKTNQTQFGRNLTKKFRKYNSGEGIVYIGLRLKQEGNNLAKRVAFEQIKVSEDI